MTDHDCWRDVKALKTAQAAFDAMEPPGYWEDEPEESEEPEEKE